MADVEAVMQSNAKITISGFPGSGKTTVAKLLAERTGLRYVSTGQLQREIAAARGMSTLELNGASQGDATIDQEIDARTLRIGNADAGVVFDSRLAWRILPQALKVFIACEPKIAGQRVQAALREDEKYTNALDAESQLRQRFALESTRFRSKYDAKLDNLRNFDLVVDSSVLAVDAVVDAVSTAAAQSSGDPVQLSVVLSPRQIYPTCRIQSISTQAIEQYGALKTIDQSQLDVVEPLKVVRVAQCWFAFEHQVRLAQRLSTGRSTMTCVCVGVDDEVIGHRLTARQWVMAHSNASYANDWQDRFGYSLVEQAQQVHARLNPGVSSLPV